jgi:hypothetical protein
MLAIIAPIGVDLIIDKLTITQLDLVHCLSLYFAKRRLLDWLKKLSEAEERKEVAAVQTNKSLSCIFLNKPVGLSTWANKLRQSSLVHRHIFTQLQTALSYQN